MSKSVWRCSEGSNPKVKLTAERARNAERLGTTCRLLLCVVHLGYGTIGLPYAYMRLSAENGDIGQGKGHVPDGPFVSHYIVSTLEAHFAVTDDTVTCDGDGLRLSHCHSDCLPSRSTRDQ